MLTCEVTSAHCCGCLPIDCQQGMPAEIPEPSGRADRGTELCMGRQTGSFAMLLLLLLLLLASPPL